MFFRYEVSKYEHLTLFSAKSSATETLRQTIMVPRHRGQSHLMHSDRLLSSGRAVGVLPNSRWLRLTRCPRRVGEETKVTDAHEASGQYMNQKPAEELLYRQSHLPLLVAMGVILPTEGDFLAVKGNQSVVGNRYPMGIPAEVSEHLRRPAEGRLGVDDPVSPVERSQKSGKAFLLGEFPKLSGKA